MYNRVIPRWFNVMLLDVTFIVQQHERDGYKILRFSTCTGT